MFPLGEVLTLALTYPITLAVGQYLVNDCFSSTPFILNQEFGMQCEALGFTANEWAVTQVEAAWGMDTTTLELNLYASGYISRVCGLKIACTFS